ncbi:MAG: ArnT family glycosyltransferase [Bacteroidia bacterium]
MLFLFQYLSQIPEKKLFFLFALLTGFMSFWQLGLAPVYAWDEARHGVNAFEMLQIGDYWNLHWNHQPDTWNAKPPLMIWAIALSYKIFGFNEWGLRFPAGLATFAYFLVSFQLVKLYEKPAFAFLVGVILMSCRAILGYHAGRTADCDAFLFCFLTFSAYFFFRSVDFADKKGLLWAAIFWGLAFYSKGFAAVLMLPGMFLYLLLSEKRKDIWREKNTYFVVFIAIFIVASYFIGTSLWGIAAENEKYVGGNNVERMILYDVFDRFFNPQMTDVDKPIGRNYLFMVLDVRLNLWNYVLYLSLLWGLYSLYQQRTTWKRYLFSSSHKIAVLALCLSAGFLMLLLPAANKAEWYLSPIFLFLVMVIVKGALAFSARSKAMNIVLLGLLLFTFGRNVYLLHVVEEKALQKRRFFQENAKLIQAQDFFFAFDSKYQDAILYLTWLNPHTRINPTPMPNKTHFWAFFTLEKGKLHEIDSVKCQDDYCIGKVKYVGQKFD